MELYGKDDVSEDVFMAVLLARKGTTSLWASAVVPDKKWEQETRPKSMACLGKGPGMIREFQWRPELDFLLWGMRKERHHERGHSEHGPSHEGWKI